MSSKLYTLNDVVNVGSEWAARYRNQCWRLPDAHVEDKRSIERDEDFPVNIRVTETVAVCFSGPGYAHTGFSDIRWTTRVANFMMANTPNEGSYFLFSETYYGSAFLGMRTRDLYAHYSKSHDHLHNESW